MKYSEAGLALLLSLWLPGCMPAVGAGSSLALPEDLASSTRVTSLSMTSDWLRTDGDFAESFNEEVLTELSRCAHGTRELHLRIHIQHFDRARRLEMLVDGEGVHRMKGVAELVDLAGRGQVVGRYPLDLVVDAGGRMSGLLGDREMMVGQGFARALCDAAFPAEGPLPSASISGNGP